MTKRTRAELAKAVRPFGPDGELLTIHIPAFDALADVLGLPLDRDEGDDLVRVPMAMRDPAAFFRIVRPLFVAGDGEVDQHEVDGCNAILAACGADEWPIGDTAYALGTAYLETAGTMQPIKEMGGSAYFTRMYDITGARPKKARELGNLAPGDGAKYPGRGYPQLTGKANYAKATRALQGQFPGLDLVARPDDAMRPDVAAAIMVRGMREGWFTGRDLDDDIPRVGLADHDDFVRSRDIINGSDRAGDIATNAILFQRGLQAGAYGPLVV